MTNSTKAGNSKAVNTYSCPVNFGISWAPPPPIFFLGLLNMLKHNVQVLESYGYFFSVGKSHAYVDLDICVAALKHSVH